MRQVSTSRFTFLRQVKYFFVTTTAFGFYFSTSSCNPDPPPDPGGYGYIRKYPSASMPSKDFGRVGHPCPEQGTGCYIFVQGANTVSGREIFARYVNLQQHYYAKNIKGFFDDYSDWKSLFPGFDINDSQIQKLINGEYLLQFANDTSFAVYDPLVSQNNLLYLFKMNP